MKEKFFPLVFEGFSAIRAFVGHFEKMTTAAVCGPWYPHFLAMQTLVSTLPKVVSTLLRPTSTPNLLGMRRHGLYSTK